MKAVEAIETDRTRSASAVQELVREFWDRQPCDSELSEREPRSREYFLDIERCRYAMQPHIHELLGRLDWRGKRVLEIGAGVGTDARSIIARGACYVGTNIDRASTEAARDALRLFDLPGTVQQGDATAMAFDDASFDVVYAFGVLHHIVDARRAVAEILRVLKPGGDVLVMLYNRDSINFALEIRFLRKLGLRLLALPGAAALLGTLGWPRAKLERHRERHLAEGPVSEAEWLSRNTNGPDNPYVQVYDRAESERLLAAFELLSHEVRYFDHRHWGPLGAALPRSLVCALGRRWGWHRVLHARKPLAPVAALAVP